MAALPPLQPISRKQKDFPSRRAYLDYKAKQSGYKNYRAYLSKRESLGVPKSNDGRGKRPYASKKVNHRTTYYYSTKNMNDAIKTLESLVKRYKNNEYALIGYGRPTKEILGSPRLMEAIRKAKREGTSSLRINNVPHTLIELTILHNKIEIPDFIEESMEEANRFFEKMHTIVVTRSVPDNA